MSKKTQATWEDLTALADGGLSANQIATRLNKANLGSPTGSRWYDSSILVQFRSQMSDAELKTAYPKLAADAAKYDQKQADKKAKAKAAAAAVDATPNVVLPKRGKRAVSEVQISKDGPLGKALRLDEDMTVPAPIETQPEGAYAHAIISGHGYARVDVYPDMARALKALTTSSFDISSVVNRIIPLGELADLLAKHNVTKVGRTV